MGYLISLPNLREFYPRGPGRSIPGRVLSSDEKWVPEISFRGTKTGEHNREMEGMVIVILPPWTNRGWDGNCNSPGFHTNGQ